MGARESRNFNEKKPLRSIKAGMLLKADVVMANLERRHFRIVLKTNNLS